MTGSADKSKARSFRHRLTWSLGVALGAALALLAVAILASAYAAMNHNARSVLHAEALNIEAQIIRDPAALDLDAYSWDEPHHRYADRHIDPYFIQVFDVEGRMLRASANVARLAAVYPDRLLPATQDHSTLSRLRTFQAGEERLYYTSTPLRTTSGAPLGYLQVARFEPGIVQSMGRLTMIVGIGWVALMASLLAVVWGVGGRVVEPLEAMTRDASTLSPQRLAQRVEIPDAADRETAELGAALNGALDGLESAFTEMKRFTADAAHELQTPLTVLLGHIEVALRRERDPAAYRDTLRLLEREVQEMVHTVRGLLSLARLDAAPLQNEPVNLSEIAVEEAQAARQRAAENGVSLVTDVAPGLHVVGHASLIREVVRNLVDNAVKYTQSGEIQVVARGSNGDVALIVRDTGSGIDPAHLSLVTRRFWRSDSVQHIPGSGLGLALVDQFARHHGGRLDVSSTPGIGTTVQVTVPSAVGGNGTPAP